MFDLSWSELLIVAIVCIIVVGPKELPNVLRAISNVSSLVRKSVFELQGHLYELSQETQNVAKSSLEDVIDNNILEQTQDELSQLNLSSIQDVKDVVTNEVSPVASDSDEEHKA